MADETILVVDADQETDQRIISTLDAEGYLVFSCSSHVVTDDMAEKCRPSLIFIKPLSPSAAGFQPCRTIHSMPKLKNVPIVLLASLKKALEPQHVEHYGIVDFLRLNFTSEELVAKTASILSSVRTTDASTAETFLPAEEEARVEEPPRSNQPETSVEQKAPLDGSSDIEVAQEKEFTGEDQMQQTSPSKQPSSGRSYRKSRSQKPSTPLWLIGLLILALLGGGGYLAYQYVMPTQKPPTREPKRVATPGSVQKEAIGTPSDLPVAAGPAASPEPAPAQAPETGQSVPVPAKPTYAAQVGAYKTEDIASVLVNKLKEKGYEAYAQKGVTRDNSPIIRVLVGNFPDRKDAVKLAGEIQAKEKIKTTIFTN